jgi:hypothetical protein
MQLCGCIRKLSVDLRNITAEGVSGMCKRCEVEARKRAKKGTGLLTYEIWINLESGREIDRRWNNQIQEFRWLGSPRRTGRAA